MKRKCLLIVCLMGILTAVGCETKPTIEMKIEPKPQIIENVQTLDEFNNKFLDDNTKWAKETRLEGHLENNASLKYVFEDDVPTIFYDDYMDLDRDGKDELLIGTIEKKDDAYKAVISVYKEDTNGVSLLGKIVSDDDALNSDTVSIHLSSISGGAKPYIALKVNQWYDNAYVSGGNYSLQIGAIEGDVFKEVSASNLNALDMLGTTSWEERAKMRALGLKHSAELGEYSKKDGIQTLCCIRGEFDGETQTVYGLYKTESDDETDNGSTTLNAPMFSYTNEQACIDAGIADYQVNIELWLWENKDLFDKKLYHLTYLDNSAFVDAKEGNAKFSFYIKEMDKTITFESGFMEITDYTFT